MEEIFKSKDDLRALCAVVKESIHIRDYENCENIIINAMSIYPHAPQPHNLLGILLEKKGQHLAAMRHFRAAWALDSAYLPVRQNLECYATFFSGGGCAYDESDCDADEDGVYKIDYDAHGIGHIVERN